jgi:8-oxo-dGTP diphosphatase
MVAPKNPYESGERKVIPAVLVYIRHQDHILMIHRNSQNPGRIDYHQGRWNGLGGKCELDESSIEATQREVLEESGIQLELHQLKPLGVVQFPNFKAHKHEDWTVFIFTADLETVDRPQLFKPIDEGTLHWVPVQDMDALNVWPGDRYFLKYIHANEPFMGTIWYDGPRVLKHWVQALNS